MTRVGWIRIAILPALGVLVWPAMASAGSAAGASEFATQCASCHSVTSEQSSTGPSLKGVVGRKAGSLTNWEYSSALKDSKIVWTPETLDAWLKDPHAKVPETGMPVPGIKDARVRAALVDYLKARSQP